MEVPVSGTRIDQVADQQEDAGGRETFGDIDHPYKNAPTPTE